MRDDAEALVWRLDSHFAGVTTPSGHPFAGVCIYERRTSGSFFGTGAQHLRPRIFLKDRGTERLQPSPNLPPRVAVRRASLAGTRGFV